ncbi:UNVERIFIED_CONTAM: hypothetical protein FKN15_054264 [Acipenser sinensis]
MRLLFQVLEDLVPQLGVFSRVVALIRDELYDGVYSLQLTTDPDLESETAETVTRLPYFSLLRRQQDEQNQKADNLRVELNQNKEILFEKEKDLGKMLQKLEDLGKETESLKHEIVSFEEELKKKNDEILSLSVPCSQEKQKQSCDNFSKSTYQQKSCYGNQKDFEACIENHKKWLLSEKFRHSTRREDHENLMKEEEFAEKQNIFQQSMADISTELALLKQHRKSLQEQLNVLEKTLHQYSIGALYV